MMLRSSQGVPNVTRVLIVDDFQEWRLKIRSILKNRPELQIICEASDGFDAIEKAGELKPDVILMDIGLPNLNGIETANRILKVSPYIKIIFLTQNSDKGVLRAALNIGARGYVLKTRASSELVPAVEAALRGLRFVSSEMKQDDFKDTEGV